MRNFLIVFSRTEGYTQFALSILRVYEYFAK